MKFHKQNECPEGVKVPSQQTERGGKLKVVKTTKHTLEKERGRKHGWVAQGLPHPLRREETES